MRYETRPEYCYYYYYLERPVQLVVFNKLWFYLCLCKPQATTMDWLYLGCITRCTNMATSVFVCVRSLFGSVHVQNTFHIWACIVMYYVTYLHPLSKLWAIECYTIASCMRMKEIMKTLEQMRWTMGYIFWEWERQKLWETVDWEQTLDQCQLFMNRHAMHFGGDCVSFHTHYPLRIELWFIAAISVME